MLGIGGKVERERGVKGWGELIVPLFGKARERWENGIVKYYPEGHKIVSLKFEKKKEGIFF